MKTFIMLNFGLIKVRGDDCSEERFWEIFDWQIFSYEDLFLKLQELLIEVV